MLPMWSVSTCLSRARGLGQHLARPEGVLCAVCRLVARNGVVNMLPRAAYAPAL
jgi:hypothetical protein